MAEGEKKLAYRDLGQWDFEILSSPHGISLIFSASGGLSFSLSYHDEKTLDILIDALQEAKYRLHSDKATRDETWEQVKKEKND